MENFVMLNKDNIEEEHICCAISDKKCTDSYKAKKDWLTKEFDKGYKFYRIDARAKVFIEYGPAKYGWAPINAEDYFLVNCLWVSGKYKKNGYAKKLLQKALADAKQNGKKGLVTIVGEKKFHFMSDTKWFLKQGFEIAEKLPSGFLLLVKNFEDTETMPSFRESVKSGKCENSSGLVAYYSNRCPFSEYHILNSLTETAKKRNIPLQIIKLETYEEAQNAPSPASIFSLFYKGEFMTTDISVCMDTRYDKIMSKLLT